MATDDNESSPSEGGEGEGEDNQSELDSDNIDFFSAGDPEEESPAVTDDESGDDPDDESDEDDDDDDHWTPEAIDRLGLEVARHGLTSEQIDQFDSYDALASAIELLEGRNPAPLGAEQAPPQDAPDQAKQFAFDLPELDPDDFEPEVFDYLTKMREQSEAHLNQLAGRTDSYEAHLQQQAAEQFAHSFDQEVLALGNSDLFGDGAMTELDGEAAENRQTLYDTVDRIASGYHAKGQELPSLRDLVKEAERSAFGGDIKRQITRGLADQLRSRQRQVSPKSKPTRRSLPKGEERAMQTMSDILAKHKIEMGD